MQNTCYFYDTEALLFNSYSKQNLQCKQRNLVLNLHHIVLVLNFLGYIWQPIEHRKKCNLTYYDEEAQTYISQWRYFTDNYDSTSHEN